MSIFTTCVEITIYGAESSRRPVDALVDFHTVHDQQHQREDRSAAARDRRELEERRVPDTWLEFDLVAGDLELLHRPRRQTPRDASESLAGLSVARRPRRRRPEAPDELDVFGPEAVGRRRRLDAVKIHLILSRNMALEG